MSETNASICKLCYPLVKGAEAVCDLHSARAEITKLKSQLEEARAAFTQIRQHTKNVYDDELIAVIDMIAEDFLDPAKRAPLHALLNGSAK